MNILDRNNKIKENIGLVGYVLKRFNHKTLSKEDMYQVGCIGLIDAAEKYKGNYGVKFSTYAMINIKNHILKSIQKWNKFYDRNSITGQYQDVGDMTINPFEIKNEIIDKFSKLTINSLIIAVKRNKITVFEKEIMQMRCGIGYYKTPVSINLISSICDLTPSGVRFILKTAFSKLKVC